MSSDEQDEFTKPENYGPDCDSGSCEVRIVRHPVLRNSERGDDVQLDTSSDKKEMGEVEQGHGVKRGRSGAKKHPERAGNGRTRSRTWVGTLNNPTAEDKQYYATVGLEEMSWLVVGSEKGESGTPHLQMACRFHNPVSMKKASEVFGRGKSFIEPMKGSAEQSVIYCSKENLWCERGVRPVEKGKEAKAKLDGIVVAIKRGDSDRDIFESNPAMYLRYRSSIGAAKQLYQGSTPRKPVSVYWYYGETGAGKSYRAEQEAASDGRMVYRQNGDQWWDGYDGHPLVIIDDFSETASFRSTLRILDVYNVLIPIKGSHVWFRAEKIWVTASYHPRKIDHGGQIERRCTTIVEMYHKDRPDIRSMFADAMESSSSSRDEIGPMETALSMAEKST